MYTIKEAFAVYTGGNIWIFYGETTDGNYFLTDDYGATLILNADPSDFEVSLYEDWQQEHLVAELQENDRAKFCNDLCDTLLKADERHQGGILDEEIEGYREYFKYQY